MTEPENGTGEQPDKPVVDDLGSVSEEAIKLFGALSEWARDHGSDVGSGLSGLAGQAATSARDINEHIATGSEECTYCPICRTVHLVRQTSPEVRAHLAVAATSLLQAAAGMLATVVADDARSGRSKEVQHIDLDAGTVDDAWPQDDQ